jgi:hypothetical protein
MSQKQKTKRGRKFYIPKELNAKLLEQSKLSNDDILIELNSSIHGLSDAQLEKHIEIYKRNELGNRKKYH